MMGRILVAALLFAVLFVTPVYGDEDDGIMGIYSVTGIDGPVEIHVMAWGAKRYTARIMDPSSHTYLAGELKGTGEKGWASLEGECTLGGKARPASLELDHGKLSGSAGGAKLEGVREEKESPTAGATPPPGATVLFDGSNLDLWVRNPEKWALVGDGAMEIVPSSLVTRQSFGDQTLHIEFRCPFKPDARGQERGNSGVYVLGRYEVQVLDSFGLDSKDNDCGGIYKKAPPLVNACYPPLTWQTYDIDFTTARYDASGKKTADAVITVRQNGVLIHDRVALPDLTPGGLSGTEGQEGQLMLQDHDNAVRYRNIWIAPRS